MTALVPTARVDGTTVAGKRSTKGTLTAPADTNTVTAASVGLSRIREVWVRVDGTVGMTAIPGTAGGVTSVAFIGSANPAGTYSFIGD